MAVLDAAEHLGDPRAHLVDVLFGMRDQIADLERPFLGRPALLDDELEIVLVILHAPADLEESAFGQRVKMSRVAFHIRAVICVRSIRDKRLDEKLAGGAGGELLVGDDENILDDVAGNAVTKVKSAHTGGHTHDARARKMMRFA